MAQKTIYIPDEMVEIWEAIENKSAFVTEILRRRAENQSEGPDMDQIIDGKRYDTKIAQLLAHDRFWDGHNWDRQGRNRYLYKTKNGRFFVAATTRWQGERDSIAPIDEGDARIVYEELPEKVVGYAEAFGEEPEEA